MPEAGRRCEVATGSGWRAIPFAELVAGLVFRLFEPTGAQVVDTEGVSRFRALTDANGDQIEAVSVPESEAEQAVREVGMFWPAETKPWVNGTGRGLR